MGPRIRRAGAAALGCVAALAVLVSGCSGSAGGGAARRTDRAVQGVLDVRARAVLHHDRGAYIGTVDPDATGYLASQHRVFADLADVPLASWSYRLRSTGAFPLADSAHQVAARVELDYALRGYDSAPVASTEYLTFTERAGRWYVASQTDGDTSGKRSDVQPWDQGPVTVVHGAHSLVLGAGTAASLTASARLADAAVPVVRRQWPGIWADRAIVEVPGSEADMAALLGAPAGTYQGIAAVTTAELRGTGTAPADRVIVNPQAFAELSALGRSVVLTHELTHVATRTATTSRTPTWLSEGFADLVGYSDSGLTPGRVAPELAADVRAGRAPTALPTTADFAPGSAGIAQAYEGAWLACRMIDAQWGHAELVAFYQATGREGVERATRSVLGVSGGQFTDRWKAYVAKELG
ncbi:hypothetical protein [Streptantibioticus parmotrematis]|uniref:hypothetical protein n=1 Tax=Streptantibioticus parmotrematis TaxID=2873249 RepID=UPI00207C0869|nr:hypothetical protein [Streptantibioticus parmotrematis]